MVLDTYGNYEQADRGQSPSGIGSGASDTADYIGVRGEGSGTSGYDWITGASYAPGIDGQRTVQVNVTKIDSAHEQLQVYMAPAGTSNFTEVIDTTVTQTLPSSFYFGFAASTGGADDLHQIDNVSVRLPVNLAVGAATVTDTTTNTTNPATLDPGDQFTYSYTLTNGGPNDDGQITVNDALPANIENASWTVTDSAGTQTGTGSAIPVNLLNGASATITVSGTVDPNATSGNADHLVTISPGAAYSLADPNEAAPVTLNIGSGGSSVSLVGANQGAATSDTAAITPFTSADIVDTFIDPGTGTTPSDTLSVAINPSNGALSATGGTYDTSTGRLTASGTATQLQAVLQSVTFTPAAHIAAPGSVTSVPITVTVTDTDSNNTTGSGNPSAAQTAMVMVTASHDTPAISGARSNQAVGDNATEAPFSAMTVTDPDDIGATASVTIAGGAANGSFTAASSSGWTMATAQNGDTTYTQNFAAQPNIGATVQAAVQALVFQPTQLTAATDPSQTVGFTVTVTDQANAEATDSNTIVTVIDSTPPSAPTGLTLAPASDSGVQGDDVTNERTPTVTGTAEAGSTVKLYHGMTELGTAVVGSNGSWSIVSSTLADGTYPLTATATDSAGNVSTASQPLDLTIDTAAPSVTAELLNDTGASAIDGITAADTITGTAAAGSTLTISAGGPALGYATADGSGVWAFTPFGLADGAHTLAISETDAAGNTGSAQVSFTLDTTPPAAPASLGLAPASDSGVAGDDITNVTRPTITGTAEAGSTVTLDDFATPFGTAIAGANGTWSITTGTLAGAFHRFTATATDTAGNRSTASSALALTIDTAAPTVTAVAEDNPNDPTTGAKLLAGSADPDATVTISEGTRVVGTAQTGANGRWMFDPDNLAPGPHSLTASDTDAAGNIGTAPAVAVIVPDPRFNMANLTASTTGTFYGNDYSGPVSYLDAQYSYAGPDNVVLGARVANVFLHSGSGEDALAAKAGSNVLDGGAGSNWLVGASGADGGNDTFFVDGRGGQDTWDTLLNFHPGDTLTLWGYSAASGRVSWSDDKGAAGYHGATLEADFGDGSGAHALITFGGLSTSNAQFATGTGTSGGISYLMVTRTT